MGNVPRGRRYSNDSVVVRQENFVYNPSIHGVVIVTDDFEGQKAFYRDRLGLPRVDD